MDIKTTALDIGYSAVLFDMAPNEVIIQDNFNDNVPTQVTGDWGGVLATTFGGRNAEVRFRNPGFLPLRLNFTLSVGCAGPGANSRSMTGTLDAQPNNTWVTVPLSCLNRANALSSQVRATGWAPF